MRLDGRPPAFLGEPIGDALPQRRPSTWTSGKECVQRSSGMDAVACRRGDVEYVITDRHTGSR